MTDQHYQLTAKERRGNQIKLLILWLVPVGLMAIAGLYYYLVQTGQVSIGSKNHGELIRPPVSMQQVFEESGNLPLAQIWDDKWTLVVRTRHNCAEQCRQALYLSRQLHIRLDKNANRVQRVLLIDDYQDDPELMSFIDREHQLLKVFVTDGPSLTTVDTAIAKTLASAEAKNTQAESLYVNFFLVDPDAWAMMLYHQAHEGNGILADLKHLLRYSVKR